MSYSLETNIVIAGVGGQGNLLASMLIGNEAVKSGYEVRISETFGISQRGGPVVTHIRVGQNIYSPLMMEHSADLIIGFEPAEAYRNALKFLKPEGKVIMNTTPVYTSGGIKAYPDINKMIAVMKELTFGVITLDATKIAKEMGSPIMMNIVMLGAASNYLPFEKDSIIETVKNALKRDIDNNIKAFKQGESITSALT